ncbi:serine/threonine-protein kinase D1044.8-like isoform X2 [Dysidea avara]
MASGNDFQGLVLNGVTPLDHDELGRGAYGRVYAVNYFGTICAAKEIHSILIEGVGQAQMQRTVESFMRECWQCSTLRHPNVIQFLGVYYPSVGVGGVQARVRLPVMVMEMMADSLTSLMDKCERIPAHIKFSIVHDVSLGLCYLHNHDPPIVHRDLSPNNILLTAHHVAKISDLGVAKVIQADRNTMTKAPGTADFMPPESLANIPVYGPPMDIFSFAGIILHTFNQQWPHPTELVQYDHKTRRRVALSEVERRQQYLDKLRGEAEVLRSLVEACLDDDPTVRPTTSAVCERIQASKDVFIKESPQDVITLHQLVEQQKRTINEDKFQIDQLKSEVYQLKSEVDQLSQHLSSLRSAPRRCVSNDIRSTIKTSLKKEAPPLIPALTSGRYHMKWTQLADLPAPMYGAYATVQDKKVYVAGGASLLDEAKDQVYTYDIDTDHWDQLPPSGHYLGIPHIIGGKLAIIGGRLSATKKSTNQVTTFDEVNQIWASFYPDLPSVRTRPGVATHLEHCIVAGGVKGSVVRDDIEVLNWIENSHWSK